jgi:hypothetical protein
MFKNYLLILFFCLLGCATKVKFEPKNVPSQKDIAQIRNDLVSHYLSSDIPFGIDNSTIYITFDYNDSFTKIEIKSITDNFKDYYYFNNDKRINLTIHSSSSNNNLDHIYVDGKYFQTTRIKKNPFWYLYQLIRLPFLPLSCITEQPEGIINLDAVLLCITKNITDNTYIDTIDNTDKKKEVLKKILLVQVANELKKIDLLRKKILVYDTNIIQLIPNIAINSGFYRRALFWQIRQAIENATNLNQIQNLEQILNSLDNEIFKLIHINYGKLTSNMPNDKWYAKELGTFHYLPLRNEYNALLSTKYNILQNQITEIQQSLNTNQSYDKINGECILIPQEQLLVKPKYSCISEEEQEIYSKSICEAHKKDEDICHQISDKTISHLMKTNKHRNQSIFCTSVVTSIRGINKYQAIMQGMKMLCDIGNDKAEEKIEKIDNNIYKNIASFIKDGIITECHESTIRNCYKNVITDCQNTWQQYINNKDKPYQLKSQCETDLENLQKKQ